MFINKKKHYFFLLVDELVGLFLLLRCIIAFCCWPLRLELEPEFIRLAAAAAAALAVIVDDLDDVGELRRFWDDCEEFMPAGGVCGGGGAGLCGM